MLHTVLFEGKVVEVRKDLNEKEHATSFKAKDTDVIDQIVLNPFNNGKGILIEFQSGKVLVNTDVLSPVSWLRKTFKLLEYG